MMLRTCFIAGFYYRRVSSQVSWKMLEDAGASNSQSSPPATEDCMENSHGFPSGEGWIYFHGAISISTIYCRISTGSQSPKQFPVSLFTRRWRPYQLVATACRVYFSMRFGRKWNVPRHKSFKLSQPNEHVSNTQTW